MKLYQNKTTEDGSITIRRNSGKWNVYYTTYSYPLFLGSFITKREAINVANKYWLDVRDDLHLAF